MRLLAIATVFLAAAAFVRAQDAASTPFRQRSPSPTEETPAAQGRRRLPAPSRSRARPPRSGRSKPTRRAFELATPLPSPIDNVSLAPGRDSCRHSGGRIARVHSEGGSDFHAATNCHGNHHAETAPPPRPVTTRPDATGPFHRAKRDRHSETETDRDRNAKTQADDADSSRSSPTPRPTAEPNSEADRHANSETHHHANAEANRQPPSFDSQRPSQRVPTPKPSPTPSPPQFQRRNHRQAR